LVEGRSTTSPHAGNIGMTGDKEASPEDRLSEFCELERRLEGLWPSANKFAPLTLPTGQQKISHFQIQGVLGRGAFGIVYLASDHRSGRQVAFKVPRPEVLLDSEKSKRFAAEAATVLTLDHPNIVKVYEVDLSGPVPFIAAAYCDGPNLAEWLELCPEPPPWRESVRLIAKVADAVQYAHQHGVVHRDLKPANVMLVSNSQSNAATEGLEDFEPKVTDFGLAKRADPTLTNTRSSLLVGTPMYMAPEQMDRRQDAGPNGAEDVYSLGVMLFELLTRQLPIRGETYFDLLNNICTHKPIKLRCVRKDLPRSLQLICSKCLEKNPLARYSTVAELASDLRSCADDLAPKIKSATWRDRFSYWSSRPSRIEIAGWFQIWSSLILCSWMLVVASVAPFYMVITDGDLWAMRWDVLQLAAIRTPIYLWLGWKVVRARAWAVWLMAFVNTIRALLVLKMLGQPVFFLALYGAGGIMPFVDHLICLIVLTIQAVLSWLAARAQRLC
jgi:serine/threonine-protein kinase